MSYVDERGRLFGKINLVDATVAAVFLGGTSIFGGRGTIFGTFVAAFVIGAIEPGIVSLGWTGLLTQVIYGAVIVGALIMQSVVMRRVR